jgi:hypothetical protein
MINPRKATKEEWREYMKARRERMVEKIIQLLGGECQCCKAKDGLQVHHLDQSKKELDPTRCNKAWSKILKELEKCELRCGPCHRKEHEAAHGTQTRYVIHRCRCDLCVDRQKNRVRESNKRYMAKLRNDPERLKIRNAKAYQYLKRRRARKKTDGGPKLVLP